MDSLPDTNGHEDDAQPANRRMLRKTHASARHAAELAQEACNGIRELRGEIASASSPGQKAHDALFTSERGRPSLVDVLDRVVGRQTWQIGIATAVLIALVGQGFMARLNFNEQQSSTAAAQDSASQATQAVEKTQALAGRVEAAVKQVEGATARLAAIERTVAKGQKGAKAPASRLSLSGEKEKPPRRTGWRWPWQSEP